MQREVVVLNRCGGKNRVFWRVCIVVKGRGGEGGSQRPWHTQVPVVQPAPEPNQKNTAARLKWCGEMGQPAPLNQCPPGTTSQINQNVAAHRTRLQRGKNGREGRNRWGVRYEAAR